MFDLSYLRAALDGPLAPLKLHRQFVLWRLESNDRGQPTKVPYAVDGRHGSSTNPATWTDANTALMYANAQQCGVGFVLTDADPFRVIDIDHCLVNGQWSALALATVAQFPGAAVEVSQSGEGLHVWLQGALPARHGNKGNGLELYAKERFIALTGYGVQPGTTANASFDTLAPFVTVNFPPKQTINNELTWFDAPIAEAGNVPASDEDLLRAFLSAPAAQPRLDAYQAFAHLQGANAPSVERIAVSNADLFNGNAAVLSQAWPSEKGDAFDRSNAAFALACRLAMWTGKDCPRIERLMNRAAFQRTRAEQDRVRGQTYMQWDILRACAAMTNVRKWNVEDLNAEVKQQGVAGYQAFYDRIASAGDIHTIRAICEEAGFDLSIDSTYRELLAAHTQKSIERVEGAKLPIADCRKMVALRGSHPAPDLRELTRRENIALSLPEDTVILAPVMSIAQMLDEFVFIADGSQVGSVHSRHTALSLPDFRNMLAASQTVSDSGVITHTEEWLKHPARKMVTTRTFHAGSNVITVDPLGRTALNTWRPIARGQYTVDISPFLEHVQYLFGDDAGKFLDWLAHIEQRPGELPHFGWLHIADITGTGRGWLASVITRLWTNYVAPSVDMDAIVGGSFNGALAGKVIAIVDEIRAGAREDAYMMEGKIRNMLTEETRYVKPKYGREYSEHNACRWLVCSNHRNAVPLSDNDRRWHVVHLTGAPRSQAVYAYLYELRKNPAFIESIAAWLRMRDISAFAPGERPPINAAKRKAIDASRSDFQRIAANIVAHWPADFITASDLVNCMYEGDMASIGKRMSAAMKHALEDVGITYVDKQITSPDGTRHRVWIVRNVDRWMADLSIAKVGPQLLLMKATAKGTGYQTLTAVM